MSSAPVISTVLSPGMDTTSLLVQALAIQRAAVTLMTLAQFSGQRAFYGAAKEWSSASFSAIEGINAAAALI
ncbi:hypothetical protein [Mycobacteroides abscessus]|uniref:hypothetical protein n=1 Tax=Mycobacteroides abscessus TaxID=36809 RepID=UPI001054A18A|nr:hypothetical protein [Mycobacteroides abscessus]